MAHDRPRWPWTWKQSRAPLLFALGAGLLVFEAFASFVGRGSDQTIVMAACACLGLTTFLIEKAIDE